MEMTTFHVALFFIILCFALAGGAYIIEAFAETEEENHKKFIQQAQRQQHKPYNNYKKYKAS